MKRLFSRLRSEVYNMILKCMNLFFYKDAKIITFIPHVGCEADGYSFINYKSDSALSLFHYIVETYGNKYKYQIATGEKERQELQNKAQELYPEIDIQMFVHPHLSSKHFIPSIAISKSKYIFTSQAIPMTYLGSSQEVYYLGYYSCNFKSDFDEFYKEQGAKYDLTYRKFFSASFLFSQMNSIVYNTSLSKFEISGLVRNDNLLTPYNCSVLDNWIQQSVEYEVKKVFLYTPTHRDYERGLSSKRNLMGFELDKNEIESFLKDNNAIIIIKIHSRQNIEVLKSELPTGILLHQTSKEYGLNELLQRADYLITDYTSAYFDFLLLDRPVLFNFYDFEIYKTARGFSFDPIKPILAGEIFDDQKSMIEEMKVVMTEDRYKAQRKFVRDLVFKYQDDNSAQRVYDSVFDKK